MFDNDHSFLQSSQHHNSTIPKFHISTAYTSARVISVIPSQFVFIYFQNNIAIFPQVCPLKKFNNRYHFICWFLIWKKGLIKYIMLQVLSFFGYCFDHLRFHIFHPLRFHMGQKDSLRPTESPNLSVVVHEVATNTYKFKIPSTFQRPWIPWNDLHSKLKHILNSSPLTNRKWNKSVGTFLRLETQWIKLLEKWEQKKSLNGSVQLSVSGWNFGYLSVIS